MIHWFDNRLCSGNHGLRLVADTRLDLRQPSSHPLSPATRCGRIVQPFWLPEGAAEKVQQPVTEWGRTSNRQPPTNSNQPPTNYQQQTTNQTDFYLQNFGEAQGTHQQWATSNKQQQPGAGGCGPLARHGHAATEVIKLQQAPQQPPTPTTNRPTRCISPARYDTRLHQALFKVAILSAQQFDYVWLHMYILIFICVDIYTYVLVGTYNNV